MLSGHRYKVYREHLGRLKVKRKTGSGEDPLGRFEFRERAGSGKASMCHEYAGMYYGAWREGLDGMLSDGKILGPEGTGLKRILP